MFPPSLKNITTAPAAVDDPLEPKAYHGQFASAPFGASLFDGQKFAGGMAPAQLQTIDYWTLRARSAQLFNENLYAAGIIRRLITNEINTGLTPEACPDESIIGLADGALADWTETVENRFGVWADNPELCDWSQSATLGELQRNARLEALICGDVLVVLQTSRSTGLPMVQLISGDRVQSPLFDQQNIKKGHELKHGVEIDARNRVVAHWVIQSDGEYRRIPATGARSGRRVSWLVYGTQRRLDDVRGQPLLALVMQSITEIDKYRDSAQRKALINSILAMFIEKTEDKPGTLPITGGAVRRSAGTVQGSGAGQERSYDISEHIPGLVIEELQTGETPKAFDSTGTDINFGAFEDSILQSIAWSNEIPPEILRLSFSNNYAASQAAINEFKIYLNKIWSVWGNGFCQPIYEAHLIAESLLGKNEYGDSLLAARRDPGQYDIYGAWMLCDWYGSIKPSTDLLKQAKGSRLLIEDGWSTNAREARITTGTKFSKNAKRLQRENQQKVDALRPLAEFRREFGIDADEVMSTATDRANASSTEINDNILQLVDNLDA